jgi:hypothetical protein
MSENDRLKRLVAFIDCKQEKHLEEQYQVRWLENRKHILVWQTINKKLSRWSGRSEGLRMHYKDNHGMRRSRAMKRHFTLALESYQTS